MGSDWFWEVAFFADFGDVVGVGAGRGQSGGCAWADYVGHCVVVD